MAYLVTGATGLVGKEILRLCEQQEIVVHYLTTRKSKIEQTDLLKGFYWNPSKKDIDVTAFKGVTKIINLAGSTIAKRWTHCYKKKILNSRIESIKLLVETLKSIDHKVTQFVSASAIGVYPSSLTEFYKEENSEYTTSNFLSKVVRSWENEADQFKALNISVAKIRVGIVLSDKEGALPKMIAPIKLYAGTVFGNGIQWQSWIHVNDIARIFLFVAGEGLSGVYNGSSPNPVTQQKLIKTCAYALDKKLWLPNIPNSVLNLILGEMSDLLTGSQRVSSKKITDAGFVFNYNTIESSIQNILQKDFITKETKALLP